MHSSGPRLVLGTLGMISAVLAVAIAVLCTEIETPVYGADMFGRCGTVLVLDLAGIELDLLAFANPRFHCKAVKKISHLQFDL